MQDNELFMSFNYSDNEVSTSTSKSIQGSHSWMKHLQEFVTFLEGCGYVGVKDKVAIDVTNLYMDSNDWSGITFCKV